jgi:Zn-dependent protease
VFPTGQSSLRLFRLFGIEVFLHWSWFLVAFYEISTRRNNYSSVGWNVAEYLALFAIVLAHEFGHSLACRSVKGSADTIVLWPLGGVAYVSPPPRAGAQLWSIAAGPLVNVVLVPLLYGFGMLAGSQGWFGGNHDFAVFFQSVWWINLALLIFNLLPIYPLDGGQILRSVLWFPLGQARSLLVAGVVGFAGISALAVYALYARSIWIGIMAAFLFQRCLAGVKYGRALRALEKLPTHVQYICPSCRQSPPRAAAYVCANCRNAFDPFEGNGVCPHCSNTVAEVPCLHCGNRHTLAEWGGGAPVIPLNQG